VAVWRLKDAPTNINLLRFTEQKIRQPLNNFYPKDKVSASSKIG
jgi:hypothetical protein